MSRHVLLNHIAHSNLKVRTERHAKYGDSLWFAQTFPAEFRAVQSCYPILLQKEDLTGKFYPVALFGFEAGENLFLSDEGWNASYIPMTVLRHPFSIGRQIQKENGEQQENLVVNVDLDSPRIDYVEGNPVFDELGQPTPFLERISDSLHLIHQGMLDTDQFLDKVLALDLAEPVTLSVTLKDGSMNELIGFYTINEERLSSLNSTELYDLHQANYLEPIYMMLGSLAHINYLVEQKNKKILAQ